MNVFVVIKRNFDVIIGYVYKLGDINIKILLNYFFYDIFK